jgi:hypothetical protein
MGENVHYTNTQKKHTKTHPNAQNAIFSNSPHLNGPKFAFFYPSPSCVIKNKKTHLKNTKKVSPQAQKKPSFFVCVFV